MLFFRKKWKLYLYLNNVCIGKVKIDKDENPSDKAYVLDVWFKKHIFGSNHIKTVVKPTRLLYTDEAKKQTHWSFVYEIGVDI